MEVEYKAVKSGYGLDEETLNEYGLDGWILSAVHSFKDRVEVGYNKFEDQVHLVYYFWREKR